MTKSEVFHQAFGYELNSIKPVHLVNGFFLALTGSHYSLEWLNKLAVVSHKRGLTGDYEASQLKQRLADEHDALTPNMDLGALNCLRFQTNAIVANDDAVYAAFDNYSAFGNDYTISSPEFLCDLKRKDGYAGFFIFSVFEQTDAGRQILEIAKTEFEKAGDSLARLFAPVLGIENPKQDWSNQYQEKLGVLTPDRLEDIASKMGSATCAVLQLLENSRFIEARYSLLRQFGIALSIWLLRYLLKEAVAAVGIEQNPLIFCDFTGRLSKKCRDRSVHCFSRHRELVYQSFTSWSERGRISTLAPFKDCRDQIDLKDVERHFQDLAVRAGIAQPRATTVRAKHYELLPDTTRTIMLSLIAPNTGSIVFQELAVCMRETWGITLGACDDDVAQLADQGIIGLDEDDDLSLNRRLFINQLKVLGLASEPSDGLVLCQIEWEGEA